MAKLLETVDLVTNFYTYEGVVKALNKVSLVVDHGSTFGLVGESGCGKSVTVRSIMRIIQEPGRIEAGKIVVYLDENDRQNGIDLLAQSEAYMENLRGDRISMIFQEPNAALNPTMSIGQQVSVSFLFHKKKNIKLIRPYKLNKLMRRSHIRPLGLDHNSTILNCHFKHVQMA